MSAVLHPHGDTQHPERIDLPPAVEDVSAKATSTPDAKETPTPSSSTGGEAEKTQIESTNAVTDSSVPAYVAVKYTFVTPKRGDLCGAFCLIYEGQTGEDIFQTFWTTRSDTLADLKTAMPWRSFNKLIPQIGLYDKVWGNNLSAALGEAFPAADRLALFHARLASKDVPQTTTQITNSIRKVFERVTHYFLNASCDSELLSKQELIDAGIIDAPPTEETEEGDAAGNSLKSFEGTLIQCMPVVDPVWGKPVSSLVKGDPIEIRIKNETGAGGLVKRFLDAHNQPAVFPVDEIEIVDDKTYIYLAINEEIRGLLTLTKDLRLKTQLTPQESRRRTTMMDNAIFFSSLALALLGFFFALRYLFSS